VRLQGTRTLSRALDALRPEPPLFPPEPARRLAVERAEAWGDEVLQPVARRLAWAVLRRDRSALREQLEGARTGLPVGLAALLAPPLIRAAARLNRAHDAVVRADLRALPELIGRVDELVGAGVVGPPERNAADFQIATRVRLLLSFDDLEPALDGRPAAQLALDVVPEVPGRFPATLPADWLAPLRRPRG
jgi:glutathione S-transferase